MLEFLYGLPFRLGLVPPNFELRRPEGLRLPSPMTVFWFILFGFFLVSGGVIYDIILEPPSVGSESDGFGNTRPVAFIQNRINDQYIMEGLASGFLFTIGSIGFIIMDQVAGPGRMTVMRTVITIFAFIFIIVPFITISIFMRMKIPHYLQP